MSVVRKAGLVLALVLALLVPTAPAPAVPPPAAAPGPITLSVMSQNTFYGGDDFDLATSDWCPTANGCPAALHRLAHVIEVSGADVVGVQEPERNTGRLAKLLGWYADPRAHVISRFPILDPGDADGLYTFVMPTPGRVVAVANIHLPSTPYGPYQVRKGWSRADVLRLERDLRLKALAPVLRVLPKLAERGIPVFLTGDFNSPSHLDWTPAVAEARDDVPYAVAWPASKALADAGFGDSYRDAHPDPVADPGYTWSPGGPETRPHDFPDRIDWVLHAGPVTTVSSRLVGERGNPQVDLAFAKPYPTDHRGVVSEFRVRPSAVREIASPEQRRLTVGPRPLAVRFHSLGNVGEVVAFQRRPGAPLLSARSTRNSPDGVVRLSKAGLAPGRYDVVLVRGRPGAQPHSRVAVRPRRRADPAHGPVDVRRRRPDPRALDRSPRHPAGLDRADAVRRGVPGAGVVPRLPLHADPHRGLGRLQRGGLPGRGLGDLAAAAGAVHRAADGRRQLSRDREVAGLHGRPLTRVPWGRALDVSQPVVARLLGGPPR